MNTARFQTTQHLQRVPHVDFNTHDISSVTFNPKQLHGKTDFADFNPPTCPRHLSRQKLTTTSSFIQTKNVNASSSNRFGSALATRLAGLFLVPGPALIQLPPPRPPAPTP